MDCETCKRILEIVGNKQVSRDELDKKLKANGINLQDIMGHITKHGFSDYLYVESRGFVKKTQYFELSPKGVQALSKTIENKQSLGNSQSKNSIDFEVLDGAYLGGYNEDLEKTVISSIDQIAAKGEVGITALVDRLNKDLSLSGNRLVSKNFGDLSLSEWIKRRMVVEALQRAKAKAAVPSLLTLLNAQCSEPQYYYDLLQRAIVNALGDIDVNAFGDIENAQAISALIELKNKTHDDDTKTAISKALDKLIPSRIVGAESSRIAKISAINPQWNWFGLVVSKHGDTVIESSSNWRIPAGEWLYFAFHLEGQPDNRIFFAHAACFWIKTPADFEARDGFGWLFKPVPKEIDRFIVQDGNYSEWKEAFQAVDKRFSNDDHLKYQWSWRTDRVKRLMAGEYSNWVSEDMQIFKKENETANKRSFAEAERRNNDPMDVGILFDVEGLGGGFYRYSAFQIFFKTVPPEKAKNCAIYDGDMLGSSGDPTPYGIVLQSIDQDQTVAIKELFEKLDDSGLLPRSKRLVEGRNIANKNHLVKLGDVDNEGILYVKNGSGVGQSWAKGTNWEIKER
jgi:hypothetical protein